MVVVLDTFDAEARARRLIGSSTLRWAHVAGVATTALRMTGASGHDDTDVLVAAAWLHDIGCADEVVDTGFHPLDGARYLASLGAPAHLRCLVANHTQARVEAEARGLAGEFEEELPAEHSLVADALTYADLTTGPAGEAMTVEARLDEILTRYEPSHVVHESIRRAAPELTATVRRVQARLAMSAAT